MQAKKRTALLHKDTIFSVAALAMILIGLATDSAIALLVMSAIGLFVMAACYRKQLSVGLITAVVSAAAITGVAFFFLLSKI